MSAVVFSSVNVAAVSAAGRRVGAPSTTTTTTKRSASVRVRAFDKFKDFKLPDGIDMSNLPSMPKGMPNFGGGQESSSSKSNVEAGIGYDPSGGEEYYVGAGKYIEDDKNGIVSKTGRDSQLVGGFAGGEEGLLKYRELLATDSRLTPTKAVFYGGRVGSDEVSLAKDFGGMAGGFPGGEIGVKVRSPGKTEAFTPHDATGERKRSHKKNKKSTSPQKKNNFFMPFSFNFFLPFPFVFTRTARRRTAPRDMKDTRPGDTTPPPTTNHQHHQPPPQVHA